MGKDGDVAVFFGLSGTGKTTLSADPNRYLIGDDEHGWSDNGIFNFEGGCYAKVVNLSKENEPDIWNAIRFGSLLENTRFIEGTRTVDFSNTSVTENTRVSYPIYFIHNALPHSIGGTPRHIFFLTCDAYGVLPPISRLNKAQAMYHFVSGYTAKVAGTELGVTEPTAVFSTCFGAPFMPLHPTQYAELLGKKLEENDTTVWLVNTGWTGGPYGVGSRMKLSYTRAMITAAMNGSLAKMPMQPHNVFGVEVPAMCPGVPDHLLNPQNTWTDKDAYDAKAQQLAQMFIRNFEKFSELANDEILAGAPKVAIS
jgi:phosphoenolpyruvate carboxykinase (ATP)